MTTAKLTLRGLYNYDSSIFDSMVLPMGIDKDIAINNILFRASDFEVLYADPDFLKDALIDSLNLVPFLFVIFVLIEIIV